MIIQGSTIRNGGSVGTYGIPDPPTSVVASANSTTSLDVSFVAPVNKGGTSIKYYTVTSNDGISAVGTSSPITVTGLVAGNTYSFTVTATNIQGTSVSSSPSNSIPTVVVQGQVAYTTPGTYSWTAPAGVTSVSVVCVGGGGATDAGGGGGGGALVYGNNIAVTPGQSYTVVVGAGGDTNQGGNGGNSYFISVASLNAGGGLTGGATGSTPLTVGGGGGAGGYSGNGGNGGSATGATLAGGAGGIPTGSLKSGGGSGGNGGGGRVANVGTSGSTAGSGGAGGGGSYIGWGGNSYAGGGVGILGQGTNGAAGTTSTSGSGSGYPQNGGSAATNNGGSGGGNGQPHLTAATNAYGGGRSGYGGTNYKGGGGAVRIIWPGTTRQFPSTNTADV